MRTKQWNTDPPFMDARDIPRAANWAGVAISVSDGRPAPAEVLVRWVDAGLTWQGHSEAVVRETRRVLVEALGPADANNDLELAVSVDQYVATFDAPNWIGTTMIRARLRRAGAETGQQWIARGADSRWNWLGIETARAAAHASYEMAVADLVRQLASTRPAQ